MGMSQNGKMVECPKMIKISKNGKMMGISKNGKIPKFSKNSINAGNFQIGGISGIGVDSNNWLNANKFK